MRRRAGGFSLGSSPTMVGALTVMIVVLAVFLAYNANNGLPFVPSYRISVDLPDANQLVPGNEVRVGGARVGLIENIEPIQDEDGNVKARLDLKLDPDVDPLPTDSTVVVRARSALGLKYLEINKGTSSEGYEAGSIVPLSAATPKPVEIDQVLSTFDEPTRVAIQENLVEFGNALAGRGPTLNAAIGKLPETVTLLKPVMKNLSSPDTKLERFIVASASAAAEVAPVAEVQAQLFVNMDTTFTALAEVARPYIQETISETPPTFEAGERAFPVIRPFLEDSAELFTNLQPGVQQIAASSPTIASALEIGAPVLADSPTFNEQVAQTAEALLRFNDNTTVRNGLTRLRQTTDIFGPTAAFITPAQTVCNYATLLFRNASSLFSQGSPGGRWQRFTVFDPPDGPNNEGQQAAAPANGGGTDSRNYLHYNPYPNTAAPGQPRECEAGNEDIGGGYDPDRQQIGNIPGNQGTITDGQPGGKGFGADAETP
jgi:virulence factor Mce-like protein